MANRSINQYSKG